MYSSCMVGKIAESISDTFNKESYKDVVLINTSDVLNGDVLNHEYVPNSNLKGQFKKTFKKGDILYSEIRPGNCHYAYIDFDAEGYIASTKLMVIRTNEKFNSKFLYYYLTSQNVIKHLQIQAESRSGTFPQITFNEISNLSIPNFEINKQNAIVKIMEAFDNKINLNQRINFSLENLIIDISKQTIQNSNVTECVASEHYDIYIGKTPPRKESEWFSFKKEDNIVWTSIKDMGTSDMYLLDSSEYLTAYAVEKFNINKVLPGSILLSFKLTIGRVKIAAVPMTTNEAIACFSSDDARKLAWIYPILKTYNYEHLGSTSSIAKAINSKMVKAMLLPMPNDDVLDDYYKKVKPLYELLNNNTKENIALIELRDTLLPKLMSGEIEV